MSEKSLHDILAAEKEASERVKAAREEAERLRRAGAQRAARTDAETAGKIEKERLETLEKLRQEAAQFHAQAMKTAADEAAAWQERYEQRKEDIINGLCRLISGEGEA